MIIKSLLPLVGKMDYLIHHVPLVGDSVIRNRNRIAGALAFYIPLLGGKKAENLAELEEEWVSFLERVGVESEVTKRGRNSFEMELSHCPYGFRYRSESKVCDAAMDFDRAFIEKLGGRLEILDTIPDGAECCRLKVRYI
jgi:predicted ArsR family transcriptional regulator